MMSETESREIFLGQRIIQYQLIRKPVKNINLRIRPDGSIFVSADYEVPLECIEDFIKKKQQYIFSTLDECKKKQEFTFHKKRRYVSGENYDILGRSLRLMVLEGKPESVSADGVFVYLTVSRKEDYARKEQLMNAWMSSLQAEIFDRICKETYQIFRKYGVPYPLLRTRYMVAKWGSCQPEKGIITLNSKLIEAPRNCIEYVILHEFVHFIYPNHSAEFYDMMTVLMPDWKDRKNELERMLL